jgi:diguanylate cyclase (GGDEF)-like protein
MKTKILIAEDDPASRRLLEARLPKWGYEVVAAADGAKAWELLQADEGPRLAILDWMMPGLDGAELCRRLRARPKEPYVYVILLTVLDREEDVVRGMEAGADDFVSKPFHPNELRARLRAGERIIDLQTRLAEASLRDPVTGLYGRRYLQEFADKIVAGALRRRRKVAVVMCDLDHFKAVNDTHGHDAGDAVLRETAALITRSVRAADIVVRFGGEEFLVVLLDVAEGDAVRVADKLRDRVGSSRIALPRGVVTPTVSAGVSEFPSDSDDLWTCIKYADVALYRAKALGRNRVVRFTPDLGDEPRRPADDTPRGAAAPDPRSPP